MKPKAPVSAVIPCFRCKATILRAVASVAAQSQVPAELILVDDCSADGTRELLQQLASQYASGWIRMVFLDQNMGAASARNAGWGVATQPYIAFLDSDDAWHPEKIRIQCRYMQAHPDVALCGHLHKLLSVDQQPNWALRRSDPEPKVKRIGKWQMMLSNRFVTPSVMLKRTIQQRFVERQRYMEDHMLWLNIVCAGARVETLKVPLAAIYKNPYGQSGLSAQWWLMERGDLGNYRRLYLQRHISSAQFFAFAAYSVVKFVRRLALHSLYSPRKKL